MTENHRSTNSSNGFKLQAILREYSDQRAEIRLFEGLGIICIALSALTPSAMLVAGVFSKNYAFLLLLISPALSLFFIIIAMALGAYVITLMLRLSDIEENINKVIGEPLLEFAFSLRPDVLQKGIGKYWLKISQLGIVVGIVPFIISLWLGISLLSQEVGYFAWLVGDAYGAIAIITLYLGYSKIII